MGLLMMPSTVLPPFQRRNLLQIRRQQPELIGGSMIGTERVPGRASVVWCRQRPQCARDAAFALKRA
jgi:hypothetical protein